MHVNLWNNYFWSNNSDSFLLLLIWGKVGGGYVIQEASVFPTQIVATQFTSLNGEFRFLERYITIFCNLLINMVKMHVNSCSNYIFRKRLNFVTFILGYVIQEDALSPIHIVATRFTTHWTMNLIILKNTSRYTVIYL